MARGGIEKLKLKDLKAREPGLYSDGANLYLQVRKTAEGTIARSWIFRYRLPGAKERDIESDRSTASPSRSPASWQARTGN